MSVCNNSQNIFYTRKGTKFTKTFMNIGLCAIIMDNYTIDTLRQFLRLVVYGKIISSKIWVNSMNSIGCNRHYVQSIAEKPQAVATGPVGLVDGNRPLRQGHPLCLPSGNYATFDSVLFWLILAYLAIERRRRAATMTSYRTSLNAKRNAAVMALWVTLGTIPRNCQTGLKLRSDCMSYLCRDPCIPPR